MQGKVDPRQFQLEEVLVNHDDRKIVALLGKLNNSTEPALLILEKKPFQDKEALAEVTSSFKTVSQYFENDVFSRHSITTEGQVSEIDAQLVFPAPEKLIKKYMKKEKVLLQETPEFYKKYTYPALVQGSESQNQWLYNILNKQAETENIVFDDPDPQNGFILLPDISFTKPDNLERFHLLAIVYRKDIRSLRELNETHLPLLLNIYKKTRECIKEKYGLDPNKVKAYVHYQPTYYHFHVHFCHVSMESVSQQFEKAHNFTGVIQNIKLKPTYYQEAMLEFLVEAESALFKQFLSESSAVQNFLEL